MKIVQITRENVTLNVTEQNLVPRSIFTGCNTLSVGYKVLSCVSLLYHAQGENTAFILFWFLRWEMWYCVIELFLLTLFLLQMGYLYSDSSNTYPLVFSIYKVVCVKLGSTLGALWMESQGFLCWLCLLLEGCLSIWDWIYRIIHGPTEWWWWLQWDFAEGCSSLNNLPNGNPQNWQKEQCHCTSECRED